MKDLIESDKSSEEIVQKLTEWNPGDESTLYKLCDEFDEEAKRKGPYDSLEKVLKEFAQKVKNKLPDSKVTFSMGSAMSGVPVRSGGDNQVTVNVHLDGDDLSSIIIPLTSQAYHSDMVGKLRRAPNSGLQI